MRYIKLPVPALRLTGVLLRAWWQIRKPATFGVKVLLMHPGEPDRCLIVRHAYGERARWALPGGGYKPKHESPQQAAAREIHEELGVRIRANPVVLETLTTNLEGKRDTLSILQATAQSGTVTCSPEIAEARWVPAHVAALPADEPISRWLTRALAATRRE